MSTMKGIFSRKLLFLMAIMLFFSVCPAQDDDLGSDVSTTSSSPGSPFDAFYNIGRASEYYFGKGDELTITVNIWGQVRRPGHYNIPVKTNLVSFISFAGGPQPKAKLDNVKIVRNVQGKSEVIKVNVKKYLNTADMSLIPNLMPGDTVVISGSILHLFSTTVQYLTQLMTVITFYNIVTQLGR